MTNQKPKIKYRFKRAVWLSTLVAIVGGVGYAAVQYPQILTFDAPAAEAVTPTEQDIAFERWLEQEIEKRVNSEEFKKKIYEEAKRDVLKDHNKSVDDLLLELNEAGFTGEKVSQVRNFLKKHNPSMAVYAEDIIKLPRWVEVLAISGKETSFCTRGVGASKNNCGAIKNKGANGFRVYANEMDALEDIAALLQNPLYRDMSIAQMNGVYCVYEEGPTGTGPCPGWTETITKYVRDIHLAMR